MKLISTLLLLSLAAAHPVAERTTVYMIGDSTMADRPNPAVNPYRGWGQLLPQFFDSTVTVKNYAVNGRSTKSFIDQGRWAMVLDELRPGDYVIIQFGHNDEKKQDSLRYTDPHGTFAAKLERFVRETRAKGATPILFTSIVRRKFAADGTLEDTHGEYLTATREVAKRLDVAFVDLEQLTRALVSKAGAEGAKAYYAWVAGGTNTMYPKGLEDDTHLSVKGATEVARLAAEGIRGTRLPLAAHVIGVR